MTELDRLVADYLLLPNPDKLATIHELIWQNLDRHYAALGVPNPFRAGEEG